MQHIRRSLHLEEEKKTSELLSQTNAQREKISTGMQQLHFLLFLLLSFFT